MSKEDNNPTKRGKTSRKSPTFKTSEARQEYLENLAMDVAEEKLKNGTASSQIICHFLNLATVKAQLEREKIKADVKLQEAKVSSLESQKNSEELYAKVILALKRYKGISDDEDY